MADNAREVAIRYGCSAVILAVPVLLFLAFCTGGDPVPRLDADASFTGSRVRIVNRDRADWTDCRASINGQWSRGIARIQAGTAVTAGVETFTRGDGERFNPTTHAVRDLHLSCYRGNDYASYSGRLR